ncbi:hypothetical protein GEMRC1_000193 [Eukaryota sp. GEM-RC1]
MGNRKITSILLCNNLCTIAFLEHVIHSGDDDRERHTLLGRTYIKELINLFNTMELRNIRDLEGLDSKSSLILFLEQFNSYLNNSTFQYNHEEILSLLSSPLFLFQKVYVYTRAGFHQEALELLSTLDTVKEAEEYCYEHGSSKSEVSRFLLLLLQFILKSQPLNVVLDFLYRQKDLISYEDIVNSLHNDMYLKELLPFVTMLIRTSLASTHDLSTQRALWQVQERKAMAKVISEEKRSCTLNLETRCFICNEKIGNKIFAILSNSCPAHIKCVPENERQEN